MIINTNIKQVFLYGLGIVSLKLISLLMLPIVTRILSPSEYGSLEVLLTFNNLLLIILSFGLSDAIFRFGGTAKSDTAMETICGNAATLALKISLVFCIPMIIFAKYIATWLPGQITAWQIIFLAIAYIPCNILMVQLDWLRFKDNVKTFVWVNFIRALIQALVVLITLLQGYGISGIMFASAVSNGAIVLHFALFQFKGKFKNNHRWQKKLFLYGLPLSLNGIADFITLWLDNWWLAATVGTAVMAKFALAIKFSFITSLLIQPFSMWWYPKRFKHLNTETERQYNANITEIGVALGFVSAFFIMIISQLIIKILIPVEYHEAIAYLPWTCFIFALKNAGDMMNTSLLLEKPFYLMWINIFIAVLTVIGFYVYIPLYQSWGVILVLNLVFAFRWFLNVYLSQKEFYLPYRYYRLALLIIMLIVSILLLEHLN